jgi:penicillin-binding protein 2
MAHNAPSTVWDDDLLRLRLLLVVFLLAITGLGSFLWRIQVAQSDRYEVDLTKQSVRRIRLPGVRGNIIDRQGQILAENRPSHGVALYMEELRKPGPWKNTIDHVEDVITRIGKIIGRPPEITREEIRAHIRRRLPLPLVAWRDLSDEAMARFIESGAAVPGVDLYTEPVRFYPQGALACHALGYVGRADPPKDEEEPFHYYIPEMVGRSGLEKSMDASLRGEAGGRLMRVDVSGYRRHDLGVRTPRRGSDIMLSIDADLQALAERILGETTGSIVILDPDNGDVLTLASSPGYDLNGFVPSISTAAWKALNDNAETPLVNRAVAGTYPPGSTFKMITALAGLVNGHCSSSEVHHCPGYFTLGKVTFRCWNRSGHGPVNLQQAIEGSCNVFFFHAGLQSGIEAIYHMAGAFGLGKRTGIELDADQPGLVPNPEWKQRVFRDGWRDGDTCNVSIGQGALLVTPLQMANMTAALANGGILYQPRLVIGFKRENDDTFSAVPPVELNRMEWDRKHLDLVRLGMKDVIMSPRGTARNVQIPGIVVAGKTGPAEYGRKEDRKRHAWMVAFAPFEQPKYAIALLIDEGVSGGETAGPLMRKLLRGIFKVPEPPEGAG